MKNVGVHGYTLKVYWGHTPLILDVVWRYYMDRLKMDYRSLSEMCRRQVMVLMDEIIKL